MRKSSLMSMTSTIIQVGMSSQASLCLLTSEKDCTATLKYDERDMTLSKAILLDEMRHEKHSSSFSTTVRDRIYIFPFILPNALSVCLCEDLLDGFIVDN